MAVITVRLKRRGQIPQVSGQGFMIMPAGSIVQINEERFSKVWMVKIDSEKDDRKPESYEDPNIGVELEKVKGFGGEVRRALVNIGITTIEKFITAATDPAQRSKLTGIAGITDRNLEKKIELAIEIVEGDKAAQDSAKD